MVDTLKGAALILAFLGVTAICGHMDSHLGRNVAGAVVQPQQETRPRWTQAGFLSASGSMLLAAASEVTPGERVANFGCRHRFNPRWDRVFLAPSLRTL
jgi:hypothetical protein